MKQLLISLLFITLNINVFAQSACDNNYAKALNLQKIRTVKSQKAAIQLFLKAKNCYDSAAKKTQCDQQIALCNKVIYALSHEPEATPKPNPTPNTDSVQVSETVKAVSLSVNMDILKFKAKGGYKKVTVESSSGNWQFVKYPDWISVSRGLDNEVGVEASQNLEVTERTGKVVIESHGTQASFVVLQKKCPILKNVFNNLVNNLKKK